MDHIAALVAEPKIDTHLHVTDPARFPYQADSTYNPTGQEIGTLDYLRTVLAAYGVEKALLVQPTSGYAEDNAALLDALAQSGGQWRGIAVLPPDISFDDLKALQAQGVAGAAFQMPAHPPGHYCAYAGLIEKLAALDMVLDIQFEGEGVFEAMSLIEASDVRVVIDHCGRPDLPAGLDGFAFRALLCLAEREAETTIKLSGLHKFAPFPWPFEAAHPVVADLLRAFGPGRCMWGSDWPFLRLPERLDFGAVLALAGRLFPDPAMRAEIFHGTAERVFWRAGV
ncbi:Predicted metal-dependent hydrolase, TIM-barrel fold [Acidocella aminolytica 101 = DSM 11237]|jgi:predicted TIM-barrel fold metal-dependent hydrolase|uniref:Amidohydrolase n=2 Tax=Acidocella TaxID=50709 RepID=A0A0D6PJF7_9PROT|nr:amidohydrolase family protein [Acidocella aminolytica]GAN81905.1 amidohydrolase [Acidocella aminolytica 101 = DSM 11237]GBQ42634.1 hypothetical protein AA11237_3024 [Acidocella aminolytica 101 = DSM 11237]SHF20912.1 Predicted metal-dependent hydrolase, TIM-barrel fold [Acidocella aminolytica 101 = DSM 11237]